MGEIRKIRPGMEHINKEEKEELAEELQVEEAVHSEAEDIYRVYMEEIAAIEPCTEAENERLLAGCRDGSQEARARLIEGNLRRALFFVQDYINRGVAMVDLIQEASIELMMLVDEGFECGFEKLLESRVRVRLEEVIEEQKQEADLEEEMLARVNVLQEVSKRLAEDLGREASVTELADRMKMTEEEIREIMKVTMNALKVSEANRNLEG